MNYNSRESSDHQNYHLLKKSLCTIEKRKDDYIMSPFPKWNTLIIIIFKLLAETQAGTKI